MKFPTNEQPVASHADWSDAAALQQRLSEAADKLANMAADVGSAKHVLEYDGDLRKRALARAMKPALAGGDSAAKAEAEGRASDGYSQELGVLGKQHQAAEQVVAEWEAAKINWETARSLLSMLKETVRQV